jgi:hypothetical protein
LRAFSFPFLSYDFFIIADEVSAAIPGDEVAGNGLVRGGGLFAVPCTSKVSCFLL